MSERDILDALNEGMLEAAREAVKSGDFGEAFENIFSVLAVEPKHAQGNITLLKTASHFFDIDRISQEGGSTWRQLGVRQLADSGVNLPEYFNKQADAIIDQANEEFLPLSNEEKKELLVVARYVRNDPIGNELPGHGTPASRALSNALYAMNVIVNAIRGRRHHSSA